MSKNYISGCRVCFSVLNNYIVQQQYLLFHICCFDFQYNRDSIFVCSLTPHRKLNDKTLDKTSWKSSQKIYFEINKCGIIMNHEGCVVWNVVKPLQSHRIVLGREIIENYSFYNFCCFSYKFFSSPLCFFFQLFCETKYICDNVLKGFFNQII